MFASSSLPFGAAGKSTDSSLLRFFDFSAFFEPDFLTTSYMPDTLQCEMVHSSIFVTTAASVCAFPMRHAGTPTSEPNRISCLHAISRRPRRPAYGVWKQHQKSGNCRPTCSGSPRTCKKTSTVRTLLSLVFFFSFLPPRSLSTAYCSDSGLLFLAYRWNTFLKGK